jgi:hypothetical protein
MRVVTILTLFLAVVFGYFPAAAQSSQVTIILNEQFFDGLLDAAFQNAPPPQFSLAKSFENDSNAPEILRSSYTSPTECDESVTVLRENKKVRTGVRFQEGKIIAPLAFTGRYNAPLLGCVHFSGSAEAIVTLDFDAGSKILRGNAKITNVDLDGVAGFGGSILARMVQGSIDKKINPIQVLDVDKLSFVVPIQNSARLAMKAAGIRTEVLGNGLNVYVQFSFQAA